MFAATCATVVISAFFPFQTNSLFTAHESESKSENPDGLLWESV